MGNAIVVEKGQRFGFWTVIREAAPRTSVRGGKRRAVEVKCRCGAEKVIDLSTLRQGQSKSCGCLQRLNPITGDRRNRLVFVKEVEPRISSSGKTRIGVFRCDCGNEMTTSLSEWNNGATKSCGCLRVERNQERARINLQQGDRFGRLVVVSGPTRTRDGKGVSVRQVQVACDCGVKLLASVRGLSSGVTKSCGCLTRELISERFKTHGHTVGRERTPEYVIYCAMIGRATNKNNKQYGEYGGMGRGVAEEWRDFQAFYDEVGPRPTPDHSIERIDNRKGYEPGNVRWATKEEQSENTARSRIWTTPLGVFPSARKAAEAHGVSSQTIANRCGLRKGRKADAGYSSVLRYPELNEAFAN